MPKLFDQHLKRWIEYIPETGKILGAASSSNNGDPPYNIVYYNGLQIKVTNFAWKAMTGQWPNKLIDHKNRNSLDDSWENLRLVTYAQNARNRTKIKSDKYKYMGVHYSKDAKWRYYFTIDGKIYRQAGYKCETSCALARDRHILKLGEQYTVLNLLER